MMGGGGSFELLLSHGRAGLSVAFGEAPALSGLSTFGLGRASRVWWLVFLSSLLALFFLYPVSSVPGLPNL